MTPYDLILDTDYMRDLARSIDSVRSDMETARSGIKTVIVDNGEANKILSDAHSNAINHYLQNDWLKKLDGLDEALEKISRILNKAGEKFDTNFQTRTDTVNGISEKVRDEFGFQPSDGDDENILVTYVPESDTTVTGVIDDVHGGDGKSSSDFFDDTLNDIIKKKDEAQKNFWDSFWGWLFGGK